MKTADSVIVIRTFSDNYIYLWQYERGLAAAVDPGDGQAVLEVLRRNNLKLTDILFTHGHFDHTGGIRTLKNAIGCKVTGPDNRIGDVDRIICDGDILRVDENIVNIIGTPGHTDTSVCYYIPANKKSDQGILFTGDTMFVGGCGRIFTAEAKTMWKSLLKLSALPEETLVYPGHDYTIENYEFALKIEPDNKAVKKRLQEVKQLVKEEKPTVPSTIAAEKQTNIFLRADNTQVKKALKMPNAENYEVFADLRRKKDFF